MTILVLNLISKCSGSNGSSEAGSEQRNWRDSGLFSLNHALFNEVFIQKVCFPVEQEMLKRKFNKINSCAFLGGVVYLWKIILKYQKKNNFL